MKNMTIAPPPISNDAPTSFQPCVQMRFKKLEDKAILPAPANFGDVGYDVYALEDTTVYRTTVVRTGLAFGGLVCMLDTKMAAHSFVKIESRSGMASKGVFATGGIIDNTYRGELKVILNNLKDEPYKIKAGDRIAQLVMYMHQPATKAIEVIELDSTVRGEGGLGSTGK